MSNPGTGYPGLNAVKPVNPGLKNKHRFAFPSCRVCNLGSYAPGRRVPNHYVCVCGGAFGLKNLVFNFFLMLALQDWTTSGTFVYHWCYFTHHHFTGRQIVIITSSNVQQLSFFFFFQYLSYGRPYADTQRLCIRPA